MFELPDNLHPDCGPVAWLLGTWRGNGHGDYPTIEPFEFGQELIFTHDGRPFFHYLARAWIVDEEGDKVRDAAPSRPASCAAGRRARWSCVLAHNTGFAEIWYGEASGGKLELQHRRRGAHRVGQGVRRPGNRLYGQRRGRPALRLRHGGHGPAAPAAPLGPAPAGSERTMNDCAGQAPRAGLPAHPAARADPGRGRHPRARHPRRGARRGPRALLRGQRLHGLPHPRGPRGARPGPARPPQRPRADVPLGHATTSTSTWSAGIATASSRLTLTCSTSCPRTSASEHGFVIDVGHLTVFGACEECPRP